MAKIPHAAIYDREGAQDDRGGRGGTDVSIVGANGQTIDPELGQNIASALQSKSVGKMLLGVLLLGLVGGGMTITTTRYGARTDGEGSR